MWLIRAMVIAFAVLWLAVTVVMIWYRLNDLINKEGKISMAYHKVESDEEAKQALPDADECGVPEDDNEAASDEARSLMRVVNEIGGHCSAIKAILATIPPNAARTVAQQKVAEVQMWAGQAFLESEL
ncbi:MAG TPA: hypothetical protein VFS74_11345 [Gemmatimonadales bacterium]|nr:hypothetical protein [Gemmatimonadales bacterium]